MTKGIMEMKVEERVIMRMAEVGMRSSDLRLLYFHINRICIKQRVKCPESSVCVLTLVW